MDKSKKEEEFKIQKAVNTKIRSSSKNMYFSQRELNDCIRLFSDCYQEVLETGSFIKKRGLFDSQFHRVYKKNNAGICSAPGKDSGNL